MSKPISVRQYIHPAPVPLYTATPLSRVRFRSQAPQDKVDLAAPKTQLPPQPSFLYRPLIWLVAKCSTAPKFFAELANPMLKPQHESLFNPIERVAFKSLDGTPLQGYWLKSTTPAKRTIVMGHGYCVDRRNMLGLAQPLRERGYNVFLFDYRAHGESGGKKSSIGFNEGRDTAAAVNFAKTQYPQAAEQLIYLGHSMGAASVMMAPTSLEKYPGAAEKLTQQIDAIVLDSPFITLQRAVQRYMTDPFSIKPPTTLTRLVTKVLGPVVQYLGTKIMNDFHHTGQHYLGIDRPLGQLQTARIMSEHPLGQKPILTIHGTTDRITSYDQGQEVYETLKSRNPSVKMLSLEGADHIARDWDPAQSGRTCMSAFRGDTALLINTIDAFCQEALDKKAPTPVGKP